MKEDQRELVTYQMERWRKKNENSKVTSISVITGKSQQIISFNNGPFYSFFFFGWGVP